MWKNLIKTAWRNLKREKVYTLISLFGLAVGLAYFAMIAVLEDLEFNADAFHRNAKRLYGVVQVNDAGNDAQTHAAFNPGPMLPALRSEFPEIENGTRVLPAGAQIVQHGENIFYQNRVQFVDGNFLSLFSFPLVTGDRATALAQPYSAILSQSTAEKYFGKENPLGKTLTINRTVTVTVTAVARDLYETSSIRFEILASMDSARALFPDMESWESAKFSTFVLLAKGADIHRLQAKLPVFLNKYFPATPQAPKKLYLLSLLDFHLRSEKPVRIESFLRTQETQVIYMQYASAIIVLLIACLNFMILATSRHMRRAREIALRKTLGAGRWELIRQFLAESVLMALLALPLALLIYAFAFPAMTSYIGYSKTLPLWDHPFLFKYLLGLTVLVGLFAGSYPALFLSKFKAALILKGGVASGKPGTRLRKILVVTQFTLAIFLIIWTLMFKKQFNHFLAVDYGYDRSQVLAALVKNIPAGDLQVLKKELSRLPAVVSVGAAWNLPGAWNSEQKVVPEGTDENRGWLVNTYGVGDGFTETVGVRLLKGRSFSQAFHDQQSLIVNETLARQLGWDQPLGRRMTIAGRQGIVVGVARDFQFRDPSFSQGPALFYLETEKLNYLLLKYRPGVPSPDLLQQVKKAWDRVVRDYPLETITLDDHFQDIYSWMNKVYVIMTVLNTVILFVASLGLLGLVSFAVDRRTKEVGIRKVLGASISSIFKLISREFILLVAAANVAGMLLGTWIVEQMFRMMISYNRVGLDAGIYTLTAAMTLGATLLAISWEIVRAARANPVDSLRYE
jgi:putative ABC transport system permease protein